MTYTVTDIAELVEHHLVASAPDDDAAHSNLVKLVQKLELLAPRPLYCEATWDASMDCQVEHGWLACESCGAWVGTELISPNGAGYTDDDAFKCSSCRWGDDDC